MTFRDEIFHYLHPKWRVVGLFKANGEDTYTCDNYHLFHTHYIIMLGLIGEEIRFEDSYYYQKFHSECMKDFYIVNRFPERQDDTSQDEIIAASVLQFLFGVFNLSYLHAIDFNWCFNLKEPKRFSFRYWFARHIDFVPIVKATARRSLSLFNQLCWAISVIKTSFNAKTNTSGKLLRFVQFPAMVGRYAITDLAISFFLKRVNMKEAYGIYFGTDHPFFRYCPQTITVQMVGNRQFHRRQEPT